MMKCIRLVSRSNILMMKRMTMMQALCLDIRVLDEEGNEIELKEEDDEDEIIYTADHNADLIVGSADEVLDAGFVIDEDSPEDIMDVFGDMTAEDEE